MGLSCARALEISSSFSVLLIRRKFFFGHFGPIRALSNTEKCCEKCYLYLIRPRPVGMNFPSGLPGIQGNTDV